MSSHAYGSFNWRKDGPNTGMRKVGFERRRPHSRSRSLNLPFENQKPRLEERRNDSRDRDLRCDRDARGSDRDMRGDRDRGGDRRGMRLSRSPCRPPTFPAPPPPPPPVAQGRCRGDSRARPLPRGKGGEKSSGNSGYGNNFCRGGTDGKGRRGRPDVHLNRCDRSRGGDGTGGRHEDRRGGRDRSDSREDADALLDGNGDAPLRRGDRTSGFGSNEGDNRRHRLERRGDSRGRLEHRAPTWRESRGDSAVDDGGAVDSGVLPPWRTDVADSSLRDRGGSGDRRGRTQVDDARRDPRRDVSGPRRGRNGSGNACRNPRGEIARPLRTESASCERGGSSGGRGLKRSLDRGSENNNDRVNGVGRGGSGGAVDLTDKTKARGTEERGRGNAYGRSVSGTTEGRGLELLAPPLRVAGCSEATIRDIIEGVYVPHCMNHNKVVWRRDRRVGGVSILIYFWDDRDGPDLCGWWFGPSVGADQVWAYHPSRASRTPPAADWNVPHDGDIDPEFRVCVESEVLTVVPAVAPESPARPLKTSRSLQRQPPSKVETVVPAEDDDDDACMPPRKHLRASTTKEAVASSSHRDSQRARDLEPVPPERARKRSTSLAAVECKKENDTEEFTTANQNRVQEEAQDVEDDDATKPADLIKELEDLRKGEEEDLRAMEELKRKIHERRTREADLKRGIEGIEETSKIDDMLRTDSCSCAVDDSEPVGDARSDETDVEGCLGGDVAGGRFDEQDENPTVVLSGDSSGGSGDGGGGGDGCKGRSVGLTEERSVEAGTQRKLDDRVVRRLREGDRPREEARLLKEEAARRQQEEAAIRRGEEEAGRIREKEEAAARQEEEQAAKRQQEEASRRREEEGARREQVQAARRQEEEEAAVRKQKEEPPRRREEDTARKQREESSRKREEEAGRRREEDASRRQQDETARRREEEGARRREEEDDGALRQQDETSRRQREADAGRRQEEQRAVDDEKRRRQDEDRRREATSSTKRRHDETGREYERRRDVERAERVRKEAERRRREDDEQQKRIEEKRRREEQEEELRRAEQERWEKEQQRRAAEREQEEKKRKTDEELRRVKEEERRIHEEELQRKREARRKKEEEELQRLEEKRREERKQKLKEEEERKRKTLEEEMHAQQAMAAEKGRVVGEQAAALAVLKALQTMSNATPINFEAAQKELEETLQNELPRAGSQREALREEAIRVIMYSKNAMEQHVMHMKRHLERHSLQIEGNPEDVAKCRASLDRLGELAHAAEGDAESAKKVAEPFLTGVADSSDTDDMAVVANEASAFARKAMAACSECAELIVKQRPYWDQVAGLKADVQKVMVRLQPVIRNSTKTATEVLRLAADFRERASKKLAAVKATESRHTMFQRFDADGDGMLNREEICAFARATYEFEPSSEVLERIFVQCAVDENGVHPEQMQQLKTALAVARAEARRRQQEAERQEKIERDRLDAAAREVEAQAALEALRQRLKEGTSSLQDLERRTLNARTQVGEIRLTLHPTSSTGDTPIETVDTSAICEAVAFAEEVLPGTRQLFVELRADAAPLRSRARWLPSEEVFDDYSCRVEAVDAQVLHVRAELVEVRRRSALQRVFTTEERRMRAAVRFLELVAEHDSDATPVELLASAVGAAVKSTKEASGESQSDEASSVISLIPEMERQQLLDDLLGSVAEEHSDAGASGGTVSSASTQPEVLQKQMRLYFKVLRPVVLTDGFSIENSNHLRRMEVGEVLEVRSAPKQDTNAGVTRVCGRLLQDGAEGWVTAIGSHGTEFLAVGGTALRSARATQLLHECTVELAQADEKQLVREVCEGEHFVLLEWRRVSKHKNNHAECGAQVAVDTASSASQDVTMVRVRAVSDGAIGWARLGMRDKEAKRWRYVMEPLTGQDEKGLSSAPLAEGVQLIDGGGWRLVRHVPAGTRWHPAVDRLHGTEVYGDTDGRRGDPNAPAWSIRFTEEDFDEFLFATGDSKKWMIVRRSDVLVSHGSNAPLSVVKSSESPMRYTTRWSNHESKPHEPWVSLTDHGAAMNNEGEGFLYGGNSWDVGKNPIYGKANLVFGANVYVRKKEGRR
eukprot:TRINITY_DN32789_c0_g1_i1.p1 TRINITY_DN32789_c0_g1~~TRINITY_DN32789_c0_g1_i1.p1  ORF type:complete len:2073 (-),score=458.55 TRINITY_DN32789_c0_g1_i1:280-6498(-)